MMSMRRALTAALFIVVVIFLITQTHKDSAFTVPAKASSASSKSPASSSSSSAASVANANAEANSVAGAGSGVISTKQKPMIDMSRMSLREKLEYIYSYDITAKFPAYIWQTWKYTPADGEFDFREEEATWTLNHPGFIHEVITDAVAFPLLRLLYASTPEIIDAYTALPLPVLKADFFRYLILYARGGIYSDIDTKALRPANEWVPSNVPRDTFGLVIGIEADPDRPDWAEWYSRRIQFCQWTIKAKPGHPALREVIARITEETLKRKAAGTLAQTLDKNVIEFTGPAVWTDSIMSYFNDPQYFVNAATDRVDWKNFTGITAPRRVGDVVVLPITGFSPGVGQMGAQGYDDPMAMVQHKFEGTWKPESERHIGEQPVEKREIPVATVGERRVVRNQLSRNKRM
ncbi:hypothetical protein TD95_005355 [Thielaviopsis punctulata]|uniref:Uncharacterized protein n=1 Tax=Thielaviopsis punctulata TaxID=72032 RepID=A0A0F4Z7F5_9PEZI|nr:hypothetical protein TD95_005355 [Thielaviopsis punctulata]